MRLAPLPRRQQSVPRRFFPPPGLEREVYGGLRGSAGVCGRVLLPSDVSLRLASPPLLSSAAFAWRLGRCSVPLRLPDFSAAVGLHCVCPASSRFPFFRLSLFPSYLSLLVVRREGGRGGARKPAAEGVERDRRARDRPRAPRRGVSGKRPVAAAALPPASSAEALQMLDSRVEQKREPPGRAVSREGVSFSTERDTARPGGSLSSHNTPRGSEPFDRTGHCPPGRFA